MAANVQDAIMLLGDSLTQGGYDLNGFVAKLARESSRSYAAHVICVHAEL